MEDKTGRPLGFVRRRSLPRSRLRPLARQALVLEVHEVEDESLLFTLHGPRGLSLPWSDPPSWDLKDADGQRLARLQPLLSPPGSREPRVVALGELRRDCCLWLAGSGLDLMADVRLVTEDWSSEPSAVRVTPSFGAGGGTELAAVVVRDEGISLRFTPALEGEPFAKMLVLAALLLTADRGARDRLALLSGNR